MDARRMARSAKYRGKHMVGDFLGAGVGIVRRQWQILALVGVALILGRVMQGFATAGMAPLAAGRYGYGLVLMVVQFLIYGVATRKIMLAEGLAQAGEAARYGQYIVTTLVITVLGILAMLILIVPGVMLFLRWMLAANFVLGRGMSMRESMAASRDATRGHRWSILFALVALYFVVSIPYVLLILSAGGFAAYSAAALSSQLGLFQVAAAAWGGMLGALGLALSIGMFAVLVGRSDHLSEVFA